MNDNVDTVEQRQTSPVIKVENLDGSPVEQETMTFPQAMEHVINGKLITKLEWGNENIFCLLKDGLLMIHLETGYHKWNINDGDMIGTDWVTLS